MSQTAIIQPSPKRTVTHQAPARRRRQFTQGLTPWLMLAPALIIVSGLIIYPAVNAIWLSFTSTNLLNTDNQKFVGAQNYLDAFGDPEFYNALGNSAVWVIGCVGFQLVFGMIGALLLNQRIRARGAIRGLVLVPWATPSVLVALMWIWMLDPNLGIINRLLQLVGLQNQAVAWFGDPALALPTLMFIDVWQGVPFFAVMILAALQGVPGELLEAAKIDGANAWSTYWRVTLPIIIPAVTITTILRLIWTANYFDLMIVITNGGPANSTTTLPLLAYQAAYRGFDMGQAAALGTIQAVILAVLVVFYIRQIRKSELT